MANKNQSWRGAGEPSESSPSSNEKQLWRGAAEPAAAGAPPPPPSPTGTHRVFNVKDAPFNAVGDGVADDTAAIQAAIDAADDQVMGFFGAGTTYFPAGAYSITSTLTAKSGHLVGDYPNNSTRLVWDGAAGGTMIKKEASGKAGNTSFHLVSKLFFQGGDTEAGTFLDWTGVTGGIDKYGIIEKCAFAGCSGDAIKADAWFNCHWTDLRWDSIGGYAMKFTIPNSTVNLSTFVLDRFTYSHNRPTNPGKGFIFVDNTAGSGNLGTFEVRNGRIEFANAWDTIANGASRALIHLKLSSGPASRGLKVLLQGITYQDAFMSDDSVLFRDTTNTTGAESLMLINFDVSAFGNIIRGNWSSGVPKPTASSYGLMFLNYGFHENYIHDLTVSNNNFGTHSALRAINGQEAAAWFEVSQAKKLQFGDGTNPIDTNLYRSAANKLKTDDDMLVDVMIPNSYTVAGVPSASGRTGGMIFISNETGGAVTAFSDGTNWRRVTDREVIS